MSDRPSSASQGGLDLEHLVSLAEMMTPRGPVSLNKETFDALIARVKQAEAEAARQGDIADNALEGWAHDQAEWFKTSARLASLQRVREAAVELQYSASWAKAEAGPYTLVPAAILKALRAALADSEEGR